MVSFLAVFAFALLATIVVSADLAYEDTITVKIDGTYVCEAEHYVDDNETELVCDTVSVVAGETIDINVRFTAAEYDSDVTIEAELEGDKVDVEAVSDRFDVEEGSRYSETLSIKVPSELKDELSDYIELNLEIDGDDYKTEIGPIKLRVQRPSYEVAIKSVSAPQSVDAGETFPVEIVVKNIGYNDLDDLYVTAKIDSLGISKTGYFGDIVAIECDDDEDEIELDDDNNGVLERYCDEDDEDSVSGKLYLKVPYGVQAGAYTLEVEVMNDDTTSMKAAQVVVNNDFDSVVFKSGNNIVIVNPTDKVVGYKIVAESPAIVSESMVFVPAGSTSSVSKTIEVDPNTVGEYTFDVNVFTVKGDLVETITFSGNAGNGDSTTGTDETNPIVILTVILAIIFIVLLIVLIVLIGKKPEKSGEFGESYY